MSIFDKLFGKKRAASKETFPASDIDGPDSKVTARDETSVAHSRYYILEGKKVVPVDIATWAKWVEESGRTRIVAEEEINDVLVGTKFMMQNLQDGDGPPLYFQTYVQGGELDGEIERYSTWEEAEIGHRKMVEKVRGL